MQMKENNLPRTPSEARNVAGSTSINTVTWYEIVLSFKVSFIMQFIHSRKLGELVYWVCLSIKKSQVSEELYQSYTVHIKVNKMRLH